MPIQDKRMLYQQPFLSQNEINYYLFPYYLPHYYLLPYYLLLYYLPHYYLLPYYLLPYYLLPYYSQPHYLLPYYLLNFPKQLLFPPNILPFPTFALPLQEDIKINKLHGLD